MLHFIPKGFVQKLCLVLALFVVSSCTGTTDQPPQNDPTTTPEETTSTDGTKKPDAQPSSDDTTETTTGNTGSTGGSGGTSNAGAGGVGGSGGSSTDGTGGTVGGGGTGGIGGSEAVVPDPCQGLDVDDHNACTTDSCAAGQAVHTTVVAQDDANVCTIDQCNPVTGQTDHVAIGVGTVNACGGCGALSNQPGVACTAGSGQCAGSGTYVCNADKNSVTCNAQAKVDGTTIAGDGNVCTHDFCSAGAESHPVKANGTGCSDGNLCTQTDTCQSGTCTAGTALTCNDGDSCTTDSCNAQTGCVFTGSCNTSNLTAVWAGEGGDKVAQEELRATDDPGAVINSVWDGSKVKIFGAKNEMVNFNLILEAGNQAVNDVSVSFATLTGSGGVSITTKPASGDALFNWVNRNIELFYIRYLEIKGLSAFCCNKYDERHIPERLRRPNYDSYGSATGVWTDRPDHNKHYPDILAPIELHSTFDIAVGQNQGIWVDLYIPKNAVAGLYTGDLVIKEGGVVSRTAPVELTVRNFTLPDTPSAQTMAYLGYQDINTRYVNKDKPWPYTETELAKSRTVRNRHFQMAHRHKISLIDADYGKEDGSVDAPSAEWVPRLDGSLFTPDQGYAGPGERVGNNVFSIGTYGSWGWLDALSIQYGYVNEWEGVNLQKLATAHANGTLPADYISQAKAIMVARSQNWVHWFEANAPEAEFFLYLIDESGSYPMIEDWAQWIEEGGSDLMSMATNWAIDAIEDIPSLDIPTSGMYVGDTPIWQAAVDQYNTQPDKRVYFYNGGRPASGSFTTEDDGVALRELAWGQFKKKIDRWFYWETTYYNNFQGGTGQTNVFQRAHTFGSLGEVDSVQGETGWNYSNGDGLLFYPGTDLHYPTESYDLQGPLASFRLKAWRRGIQDVDYLTLAAAIDPQAVAAIVNTVVPKVLWEYGVDLPSDPTYVHTDISWSTDPDVWEVARKQLADIIEGN